MIGVPVYLRMPVWVDVTYHDLSAWNIQHGGVHYRDVFETNLPGMVWVHALLRPAIGWSHESIRVADLTVFAFVLFTLTLFLRAVSFPPPGFALGGQGGGRSWQSMKHEPRPRKRSLTTLRSLPKAGRRERQFGSSSPHRSFTFSKRSSSTANATAGCCCRPFSPLICGRTTGVGTGRFLRVYFGVPLSGSSHMY